MIVIIKRKLACIYWVILANQYDFISVPNGDSGQSGLKLQLFPMETIVTSNQIGQYTLINHEITLYNWVQVVDTDVNLMYTQGPL